MTQPNSDVKRSSWRDLYRVHPAADCFPMMVDAELDALAQDIKTYGLREHVKFWRPPGGVGPLFVLDGRNRLEAMARLGGTFHAADAIGGPAGPHVNYADGTACYFGSWQEGENPDPAAYVISLNIKRRHLTKEQQAELIVKAVEASATFDRAKVARSFSPTSGKKGGSTKDTILAKAVTEAAKHGISKRTVQNARAKAHGKAARRPIAKASTVPPITKTSTAPGLKPEALATARRLRALTHVLAWTGDVRRQMGALDTRDFAGCNRDIGVQHRRDAVLADFAALQKWMTEIQRGME